mmetsp:Transcript_53418/g.114858  ORF Transcript_53418/g.114858 Transcript_53418/m.114858 type:complete len:241 (-) Transcript_53418:553-1275(-)
MVLGALTQQRLQLLGVARSRLPERLLKAVQTLCHRDGGTEGTCSASSAGSHDVGWLLPCAAARCLTVMAPRHRQRVACVFGRLSCMLVHIANQVLELVHALLELGTRVPEGAVVLPEAGLHLRLQLAIDSLQLRSLLVCSIVRTLLQLSQAILHRAVLRPCGRPVLREAAVERVIDALLVQFSCRPLILQMLVDGALKALTVCVTGPGFATNGLLQGLHLSLPHGALLLDLGIEPLLQGL